MNMRHWWAALAFLTCVSNVLGATDEAEKFNRIHAAIGAAFPEKPFSIWAGAEGDVNRDGLTDYAAVVVLEGKDGEREERLVMLAGTPDGNFKLLSVSGEFCHPRKFYNLDIGKSSLFVQVVEYVDANRESSYTLHFRYNTKLNDLELIGDETHSQGYEESYEERTSSNYLTGKVIHSTRKGGKTKTTTERIVRPPLSRLNGYACFESDAS